MDNNHTVRVVGLQLSPSTGPVYIYKSIQHMDECVREKKKMGAKRIHSLRIYLPPPSHKKERREGREKESSNSEKNPLSIVTHK